MIIIKNTNIIREKALVATIGFFDGVHTGHRFLINELKQQALLKGLPSAVITFPQHPRSVLQQDYQPKLINTFEEKLHYLSETGIDYCILLDFTRDLSLLTANEFITRILADKMHVRSLLIGYDHRFGHNRADGFEQYVDYGKACGMEVLKASQYTEGKASISSSEIRRLLLSGKVEKANKLLTYPYSIEGIIVEGYKVGRQLGFPTANIRINNPHKIIPGIGVYAVTASVNGILHKGMLYIGNRPTLDNGTNITIEIHIFDFSEDIYGENITIHFLHHVRNDIKFDSLDKLIEQLHQDQQDVVRLLSD